MLRARYKLLHQVYSGPKPVPTLSHSTAANGLATASPESEGLQIIGLAVARAQKSDKSCRIDAKNGHRNPPANLGNSHRVHWNTSQEQMINSDSSLWQAEAKDSRGQPRGYVSSLTVALATVFLVFTSPFGGESTSGWAMLLNRAILLSIIGLCWVSLRDRESLDFGIGTYILLGTTLTAMFAAVWVADRAPLDGVYLWYQHAIFAGFFILLARFNRTQSVAWKASMLGGLTLAITLHCVWSLINETPPLLGSFINTNYFGSYLLVGFACSLATAARHPALRRRILGIICSTVLFFGITQTLSRGALIAAVGVTILAVYKANRRIKVAAGMAVMVLVVGFSPQLISKFADLGKADPYNYMRSKIWVSTLSMIKEYPLTGVGLEAYQDVASRFPVAVEGGVGRYARRHRMAHSEYLHYAAEIGIPATIAFSALLAYLLLAIARARSRVEDRDAFINEAGFLAAAGVGAHALVDNNFTTPVIAAVLAVVSLAHVPMPRYNHLRLPRSLEGKTALVLITAVVLAHSTLVPALATYFNESGEAAFRAGRLDRAVEAHRFAVALSPDHPLLLSNLGAMYLDRFARSRDAHWLDAADAFLLRAVRSNPDAVVARRQRQVILNIKLNTDSASRELLGESIRNAREILRVDPVSVFVRGGLAEALHASGEHAEAMAELRRAIEIEPNFVPAYRRLAEWHAEAGDVQESKELRQEADRIVSKFQDRAKMNGYEIDLLGFGAQVSTVQAQEATP